MLTQSKYEEMFGTQVKKHWVNLNLYNFESNEALNYPYILTSPRSLKACKLADVKPIELLHRSLEEVATDLNLPVHNISHIYIDYEHERLRKLEMCKLIRKHMLTADMRFQDLQEAKSIDSFLNRENFTNNPFYCSRGNTPEGLKRSQSYSPCFTPSENTIAQYNSLRKQKNKIIAYSLSNNSSISSLETKPRHNQCTQRSKSTENKLYRYGNSKKGLKQATSSSKKRNENKNKKDASKRYHTPEKRINDQQLCWQIDKVKKTETENTNKKLRINRKNAQEHLTNTQHEAERSNFINNCEKVLSGKQDTQKKQTGRKYTLKNKEQGKSSTKQKNVSHAKSLHDKYNESVKCKINDTSQSTGKQNEFNIDLHGDGIKNHDARILDAMLLSREKQQLEENFVRKANLIWNASNCNMLEPMKNACTKTVKKFSKTVKPEFCTCREDIAFDSYFQQIKNKMKQLKEDSLNKELHSEQVRQLARELQVGMEQWQDQVLLLQWRALQRARINAKLHLENKRLKTQCENNERALLHALRFRNVQDMERIKQQIVKKEIQEKDHRIQKLKLKREREILDCKAQAQYTAELREQLRRTLTPETFDRKVNDAMIKSKFINRSLTASPFTESHIRLG